MFYYTSFIKVNEELNACSKLFNYKLGFILIISCQNRSILKEIRVFLTPLLMYACAGQHPCRRLHRATWGK